MTEILNLLQPLLQPGFNLHEMARVQYGTACLRHFREGAVSAPKPMILLLQTLV